MKIVIAILLASVLTSSGAEPRNQLELASATSRRYVLGKAVDISPLIKWRAKKRGDRPLTAWHYMTGRILSDPPGRWVMEVQIEGEDDTQKIILQHPPESARTEFYRLKAEHSDLLAEANATAADVNDALESKADARLIASSIDAPERPRTSKDLQLRQAQRQAAKEYKRSAAEADSASERATAANKRLKEFDKRGYDLLGEFTFSGYALRTKEVSFPEKLSIFEHGILIHR